jgi:hypothetical protein
MEFCLENGMTETLDTPKGRRGWLLALRLAVTLSLLGLLLKLVGWQNIGRALAAADVRWLAGALALYVLGVVIRGLRLQILLQSAGPRVGLGRLTALTFVGFFFNMFLPTGIGGDAVRAVEISRDAPAPIVVSSMLVDRALGLLSASLLALLVGWLGGPQAANTAARSVWLLAQGLTIGLAAGLWLLTQTRLAARFLEPIPRVGPRLSSVARAFAGFTRRALLISLGYGLLFGVTNALNYAALGAALGVPVPLTYYILVSPLITLILLAPISLNGLGTRDAVYLFFFTPLAVAPAAIISMSVLYHGLNLLAGLAGGGIYAWLGLAARAGGPAGRSEKGI